MKINHPTYGQLHKKCIPKIRRHFKVDFLTLSGSQLKLVKFIKIISPRFPLLMIMAGCHGEESAPSLMIFKHYQLLAKTAQKHKINLTIYPMVNSWGFDRNQRLNRMGLDCNRRWIHSRNKPVAEEIKIIAKDIKKTKPSVFISLHEYREAAGFFVFTFGERTFEKPLLKVGERYFPVFKSHQFPDEMIKIKNGVVRNRHDGSAEDWLFHKGCRFSVCTETPLSYSFSKRIKCNLDLLLELIKLI